MNQTNYKGKVREMNPISYVDKRIEEILIRYRSTADAAWSEVKDGFYTQEEYEVALRKITNQASEALKELILEAENKARSRTLNEITVWANEEMAKAHMESKKEKVKDRRPHNAKVLSDHWEDVEFV